MLYTSGTTGPSKGVLVPWATLYGFWSWVPEDGLRQGEGVIFPVHHRPVRGTRGTYRVNMRHGVSRLRSGQRHTAGIIFHDAK